MAHIQGVSSGAPHLRVTPTPNGPMFLIPGRWTSSVMVMRSGSLSFSRPSGLTNNIPENSRQPAPARNNPRIRIGDVGFIRRGQYHLLFSAGYPLGERKLGRDVPDTFEELDVGSSTSVQPRQPGCLRTDTVHELEAGGSTVPGPQTTETNAQFSFELTGNRGAALVTKYSTYNEDSLVDSAFVKYTKQHYESWVKFARDKQYGDDIQPILVSGFDMTRDFAMVAYSYEGTPRAADSIIRVPAVGLTPSSIWGTWRTSRSPHTNSGPHSRNLQSQSQLPTPSQSAEVAGIPSGFDQCVFIRYYSMRSRGPFFMFPKVIRAGAGPHDPGSGDREGDADLWLMARSEDQLMTSSEEDVVDGEPSSGDSGSETGVVIRNAPSGDEYENWDAIAEYVFQNSDADFVLMHHRDLAGVYMAGGTGSVAALLKEYRPQIVVDAGGVGRIAYQELQRPRIPSPITPWVAPGQGSILSRLYDLDRSSPRFPEQLDEILHSEQWEKGIEVLLEDEITRLVVFLDEILASLISTGAPFRKCLHVLRNVCSSRMILPPSYELSGEPLFSTDYAFAISALGDVYEGTHGRAKVCIKRPRVDSYNREKFKQALFREAVVWRHLDHPNIVPFRGVTFRPLQLVSDWIPGGELREHINNNSQANLISVLLGAARGLAYLHSCNVVHGDVKGANILIDVGGSARIVDFGLATVARDPNSFPSTTVHRGHTPRFTAPEILKDEQPHSKGSDIFAFGMVIIEAFTGRVPFSDCGAVQAMLKIVTGQRPERPIHPGFTDDLWTLTQRCWEVNPQDRPQMDSIIKRLGPYENLHVRPTQLVQKSRDETPQQTSTTLVLPPTLFPPLPHAPPNVFGRDALLDDIIWFVERSESITLCGAGGIGKTAIALALLHHSKIVVRFGMHRYFVSCDNIENSLDGFLKCVSEAIGIHHHTDSAQLQSHFTNSHPRIIVLDGADFLLDPRTPASKLLLIGISDFARCQNICLLITCRRDVQIPYFCPSKNVPPLTLEASRDVFHGCCFLKRSASIDTLLGELGFHPLSIALLAGAAKENNWDERTLLERWYSGKTKILKAPGLQSLEEYIESILRTPTIQGLGTIARETLEVVAKVPGGVQETRLLTPFPRTNSLVDTVDVLCSFSLMYRQDGFIKMLPPFRLYFERSGCASDPKKPERPPKGLRSRARPRPTSTIPPKPT